MNIIIILLLILLLAAILAILYDLEKISGLNVEWKKYRSTLFPVYSELEICNLQKNIDDLSKKGNVLALHQLDYEVEKEIVVHARSGGTADTFGISKELLNHIGKSYEAAAIMERNKILVNKYIEANISVLNGESSSRAYALSWEAEPDNSRKEAIAQMDAYRNKKYSKEHWDDIVKKGFKLKNT